MKIFAAGIFTETNTFSPIPTGFEDFQIQRGSDVRRGQVDYASLDLSSVWGKQAAARGDEFVFALMAFAQPSGTTVRSAYEALRDELLDDLRATLPVDVVLLNLHGAMVAHGYDDCEEDIIRRVRAIIGRDSVLAVELDLHCHLSASKIAEADIVLTYKEYPHVDVNDRARELFDLAVRTSEGEIRPTCALFDCRMIGLYPTTREPLRSFVDGLKAAEARRGVLSVSFGHGFQFADVPNLGAKILVITNNDSPLAVNLATELGHQAHELRREIGFDSLSLPMEEALHKALSSANAPIVVAEQSDMIGAGAPGDATYTLRWLLDQGAADVAMAIFYDPEVVRIAKKAGRGASLTVRLGGKLGPSSGQPIDLDVSVLSLCERYVHELAQASGNPWLFQAGDIVALRCGERIDIVVSSERCQCFSPQIFRDLGIDPKSKKLLIPKSIQHFYGAFAPIAGEVIYMAGPGAVPPDPRLIPYSRFNTSNMYPWIQSPTLSPATRIGWS